MSSDFTRPRFLRVIFYLACLAFAFFFTIHFARLHLAKVEYGNATLEMIVNGTAPTTFQYRVLIPWIIGFLRDYSHFPINTLRGYAFASELAFTFLLLVAFWHYLGCFFKDPLAKAAGVLIFGHVLFMTYIAPRGFSFYYIYDVPGVFFFCLGLFLMRKSRWILFYPVFFIATLNRQTTCFLTVIYFLTAIGKKRFVEVLLHCALQFIIWMGISYALGVTYRDNGTELAALRPLWNLKALMSPHYLPMILSGIGYVWILAFAGWRLIEDHFVRRSCLVLPFFLAGAWVTGNIQEVRVYGELIPVFVPAFLLVLARVLRTDKID